MVYNESRISKDCITFRRKYYPKNPSSLVLWGFFLPCHRAHGVFVPRPGIEPVPPTLAVQSLNHWTARVPQVVLYLILCYFVYIVLALIFDTYENVREEQLGGLCFQRRKFKE